MLNNEKNRLKKTLLIHMCKRIILEGTKNISPVIFHDHHYNNIGICANTLRLNPQCKDCVDINTQVNFVIFV